jgi:predicted NBD/HSP70 family sugar kinase
MTRPVRGIGEIIARARAGERCAVQTLEETAKYLGIGIANLVNGLNVPAFVIGGEIVEAWPLMESHIRTSVERHAFMEYVKNVSIAPASLGPQSSLMGAVARGLTLQDHTDSVEQADVGVKPSGLRPTLSSASLRPDAF